MAKNLLANAGDVGSIPESGISPGVVNSNPLQHSHLENPTDRGAWRATVHRVTESGMTEHTHHPQLFYHKTSHTEIISLWT